MYPAGVYGRMRLGKAKEAKATDTNSGAALGDSWDGDGLERRLERNAFDGATRTE
jgi:hypothetical protein